MPRDARHGRNRAPAVLTPRERPASDPRANDGRPIGALNRRCATTTGSRRISLSVSQDQPKEGALVSAQLSDFARSLTVETAFTVLGHGASAQGRGQGRRRARNRRQPVRQHRGRARRRHRSDQEQPVALLPLARHSGVPRRRPREFVRDGVRHSGRGGEHRRRPRREGLRAVLLRGVPESRRRRARLQPVFPDVPAEHRAPRRARRAHAAATSRIEFRPDLADIERFLNEDRVAARDLSQFAAQPDRRRRDGARTCATSPISSAAATSPSSATSPTATWSGRARHHSLLSQPGMLEQCVAAYTFSKSYSMSGWRLGFAVASRRDRRRDRQDDQHVALVHAADRAARRHGGAASVTDSERDEAMQQVPREGRAADRGPQPDRRLHARSTRRQRSTCSRTSRRSAIASASRATAWRCTCWRAPTTTSASPASAANASARPAAGFLRFSCAEPNERLRACAQVHPNRALAHRSARDVARRIRSTGSRSPMPTDDGGSRCFWAPSRQARDL